MKKVFSATLLIKPVYALFAFILAWAGVEFYEIGIYRLQNPVFEGFISLFSRNDTGWYNHIVMYGHQKVSPIDLYPNEIKGWVQSHYAFFPLFPLIISILVKTGMSFMLSGLILVTIFSAGAFYLFYVFAKHFLQSEQKAWIASLCFLVFPFNYYYSMIYSEGLFLLLLMTAFLSILRKKWVWLTISASLLVLTRPNGLWMALPLLIFFIEQHREDILKRDYRKLRPVLLLAVMPLTMLGYCIYLYYMTGDFFAFATAQKGWNKSPMFPLLALFRSGDWHEQFYSIYTILGMIAALLLRKRLPLSLHVFIWINILLPLSAGSVASMPRYISGLFPYFLFLGDWLGTKKYRYPVIGILLLLQLWTFYFWVIADRFSY